MKQITNNLEVKFNDISHEVYRVYKFPCGNEVRIDSPIALNVSASGGHRVQDSAGKAHYIPAGWVHLYWETNDDVSFWF